jgi:hypothetical protein
MDCRKPLGVTYVDEEAGVLQSGLLADLLHDFGLCVEGHFDEVSAGSVLFLNMLWFSRWWMRWVRWSAAMVSNHQMS